jgi:RNA polymerase sigma-70 factor, ECF subfamily
MISGSPDRNIARPDREAAVNAFLGQRRRAIAGSVHRRVGNYHDGEDVVQETLEASWRNRKSLGELGTSADAYVWIAASSKVATFHRKEASRRTIPIGIGNGEETSVFDRNVSPSAEDSVLDGEEGETVRLLKKLHPRRRQAVTLFVLQGLSQPEVAQAMGTALGTAKSNIFRGLAELRALVENKQDQTE